MKALLISLILSAAIQLNPKAPAQIPLSDGWRITQESSSRSYPAAVPSTVAGALMDCGALPAGLLESDNLKHADPSLFEGAWTYSIDFDIKKPDTRSLQWALRFDGLSYRADITLNGTLLASADTTAGVFIEREFDVTRLLKKHNTLSVKLQRAGKGELAIGFVDWNPAPPDGSIGIVRPVMLISRRKVALDELWVNPVYDPQKPDSASLEVSARLRNLTDAPFSGILHGEAEGLSFEVPVTLDAGEERILRLDADKVKALKIKDPRIWWSRDLGSPEMYSLQLSLKEGKNICDKAETAFGIRSIESRLDEYGHRAYWLNGRKLLLLGGGWTDDIFLRDTPGSIEHQINMVADMGLNCIRFENIWGKDDTVYDLCDRAGILALAGWSCQWEWEHYCGVPHHPKYGCIQGPELNALALRYFRDQVKRLRNHPSIIGWLTGSDRIPNPELEEQYLKAYAELDRRPYVCSASGLASLAGPSGNKMSGPYEYVGPEYWYLDRKRGGAFGFNTETSIGLNIPQIESLRRMLPADGIWPVGEAWNTHCTVAAEGMNSPKELLKAVNGQYGEAGSLESFVARSQALDYEGTRAMFEAFRVNRERCTGLIQWMLNSAWPSLYWQLYDWYGVPTAGYYGVKKACSSVQMMFNYADGNLYIVNGGPDCRTVSASIRVFDAGSKPLEERSMQLSVPSGGSIAVHTLQPLRDRDLFVFTSLSYGEGAADNFYALPASGNVHQWEKSNWFQTPISRYADMRFLARLPEADLLVDSGTGPDGLLHATVANRGKSIAFQVVMKLVSPDGQLVPDALWSDNFFSLAPGESKELHCRLPKDCEGATVSWTAGL